MSPSTMSGSSTTGRPVPGLTATVLMAISSAGVAIEGLIELRVVAVLVVVAELRVEVLSAPRLAVATRSGLDLDDTGLHRADSIRSAAVIAIQSRPYEE